MEYVSTVFSQMVRLVRRGGFTGMVKEEGADRYTKHYTTWNQFLVNLYAQVTGKKSLREIEVGLKMHQGLWYHWGLHNAARSTISYANRRRSWRLFERLFYEAVQQCRDVSPRYRFRFKNPLHILDATMIEVCLSLFPWARYQRRKGAFKIHALMDARTEIPTFAVVTEGTRWETHAMPAASVPLSPDSILVADKGYVDFLWLYELHQRGVFFVVRARDNMQYAVLGQHPATRNRDVLADEEVRLTGRRTLALYPEPFRLVTWFHPQQQRVYRFLTNNVTLAASTIARIYQARWEIESFFRWIKQNLRIKSFLGTSPNAVFTQIWTALTYYLLAAYIKYQTRYRGSLGMLTRVLRECACMRRDIIDLLHASLSHASRLRDPCEQPSLL